MVRWTTLIHTHIHTFEFFNYNVQSGGNFCEIFLGWRNFWGKILDTTNTTLCIMECWQINSICWFYLALLVKQFSSQHFEEIQSLELKLQTINQKCFIFLKEEVNGNRNEQPSIVWCKTRSRSTFHFYQSNISTSFLLKFMNSDLF